MIHSVGLVCYFFMLPMLMAMGTTGFGDDQDALDPGSYIEKNGVAIALLVVVLGVGIWLLRTMVPHWIDESTARKKLAESLTSMPKAIENLHDDVKRALDLRSEDR